jgi:hypothetical protein
MWVWMHKNTHRINAHYISEVFNHAHCKQPIDITQMVVDAVVQYNEMLPLWRNFKGNDFNERLIKEAKEESAKVFLDGILDIIQRRNSSSNYRP